MEIEQAELEVLVPQATQLTFGDATPLSSIPLRTSLHFESN